MSEQLSDIQKVMRINRHAVAANGQLKSLSVQYADYALARERLGARAAGSYLPLVLSPDCSVFGIPELESRPLVLFNGAIRHISYRHELGIEDLESIADEMMRNVLAFEDPITQGHFVFVLQIVMDDAQVIAALDVNATHTGVEINALRSVHPKDELSQQIMAAVGIGKKVFVNERTGAWLYRSRNLPEDSPLRLDKAVIEHLSDMYCTQFPEKAAELGLYVSHSPLADAIGEACAARHGASIKNHEIGRDER